MMIEENVAPMSKLCIFKLVPVMGIQFGWWIYRLNIKSGSATTVAANK